MKKQIKGWRIFKAAKLKDLQINYIELEHIVTRARYIHLGNQDKESVFAVAFRTIPQDASGAAHILEHSVLAGSKNFPVRDPFFSMLKRSLCTFMNAFTSADWTAYPFATKNKKDYFNLLGVYLDAAFFPLITDETFRQEGVRLDFEGDRLVHKGVVYNEMKGSLSSPERIMEEAKLRALFPRSAYRFNSGGDPSAIPRLSAQKLRSFHKKYYHPSNAVFYSYGALPLENILEYINEKAMAQFSGSEKTALPRPEPAFAKPRRLVCPYPFADPGAGAKKYQAALAFRTAGIASAKDIFVLELLEDILLGSPSAPLRQVLFASGLGSELSDGSGLDTDLREAVFSCGLKDIGKKDIPEMERIIFGVLRDLAQNGIPADLLKSSLAKLEIAHREASCQPYPYGMKLWLRFLETKIWQGDAYAALDFSGIIKSVRKDLARRDFFNKLIRRYFLDNKNRALVILAPDKDLAKRQEKAERSRLDKIRAGLNAEEITNLKSAARGLTEAQDKKEDLSVLPGLGLGDIPVRVKKISGLTIADKGRRQSYTLPLNGLYYFSGNWPLPELSLAELKLLPLFSYLLPVLGTKTKGYEALSRAIDQHSGGIYFSPQAFTEAKSGRAFLHFAGAGKCLERQISGMHRIFKEIFFSPSFADLENLRKFILEFQARQKSGLIDDAARLAMCSASAGFSVPARMNELWNGISQLKYIDDLCLDLNESALKKISESLDVLGRKIRMAKEPRFLEAGQTPALKRAQKYSRDFSACFASAEKKQKSAIASLPKAPDRIGYQTAAAVSFLGLSFPVARFGQADAPALMVLSRLVARNFFHREIREKGGAYGGGARYNSADGIMSFFSYRDPHILATLDTFCRARAYAIQGDYGDAEVLEAIIQSAAELDQPHGVFEEAAADFQRRLMGADTESRQAFRRAVLSVSKKDLQAAGRKYLPQDTANCRITAVSYAEKLRLANSKLKDKKFVLENIG